MRKTFVFLILLFFTYNIFSQSTLQGIIKDKDSGNPMPGVAVYIHELQKGVITKVDGSYKISNIPQGNFQIHYSMMGYSTIHQNLEIGANKTITRNIDLEQKITVTQEVTITAVGFGQQHDNAIKVDIIKPDAIASNVATGAMQKLESVPGVDIISRGNGIGSPVIRGLSLTNILALNNNVRIENFQSSADHPFLIDDLGIERVEIIKGPASILYGSNAVGGVINFIKEAPAPIGSVVGDASLGYNSNAQGLEGNLGVKGSKDKFFWGIRSGIQSFSDYQQPDKQCVPNSRFNRKNVEAMAGFNTKNATFKLYYDFMNLTPGLVVPPAQYQTTITNGSNRKMMDWYQNLNYNLLSSKNTLFLKNKKIDFNFSYQNNRRKLIANQKEKVNMFLQNVGYDLKTTYNNDHKLISIIGIQGNYSLNKNGNAPEHVLPDYTSNEISGFCFSQWKPIENLSVQLGIRYNFVMIDVPAQYHEGHLEEALSRNYRNFNFTAGGTYNINKHLLLRANFAKAFRPPAIAELTQDGGHGARAEFGNMDLKTQQNYETDLSLHYHLDKFLLDISGFYNSIENYIYLQFNPDTTYQGLPVYHYQQTNANLHGMETGFRYLPNQKIEIDGSYSYVVGVQKDGEYLPWIPQNKIKTKILFKNIIRIGSLSLGSIDLNGTYAFSKENVAKEEQKAENYFVLNAGLKIKMPFEKTKMNIYLYANNILNASYIDFLSQLKDQGYYAAGRYFSLKVNYHF